MAAPTCAPVTVVDGLQGPSHLEIDDGFVYYFNHPPNIGVYRAPKAGGGAPQLIGVEDVYNFGAPIYDYDVDAAKLYVMEFGGNIDPSPDPGAVIISAKDGGQQDFVMADYPGDCRTEFLVEVAAAGDGTVYLLQVATTRDTPEGCTGEGDTAVARLDAGAPLPVVLARVSQRARNLRADAYHVFWTDETGVWRMARAGGAPQRLIASASPPLDLAVDLNNAYYTTANATYRIDAPGRSAKVLDQRLAGLRSDGAFLYGLLDRGAGMPANLVRVKPNGHGYLFLAKAGLAGGVAFDESYVYYLDPTLRKIQRTCK